MGWTVGDVMRRDVYTVEPSLSLLDLETDFSKKGASGFPVVSEGRLVGVVSRSDVVRQLTVERSNAEQLSDFYRDYAEAGIDADARSVKEISAAVGVRMAGLRVQDVMADTPITVRGSDPLHTAAERLVSERIHRVPVLEGERLVGIVTTLDLVRLVAEQRVR